MRKYKAKNGNIQYKPNLDDLMRECENDNNSGYCLACGEQAFGIEPDARKYQCESCGMPKVYGSQELLLMGLYYSDQGIPDNRTSHDYGDPRGHEICCLS
jgi:ribosomal protein L37E